MQKLKIEGRKWADEVISHIEESSEVYRQGFLKRFTQYLADKITVHTIDATAMTDEESKKYGGEVLNFGKYKDTRLDEIPFDYLEWLCKENMKLSRYLRSKRILKEIEELGNENKS